MSVVNSSIPLQVNPSATAGPDQNALARLQLAQMQIQAQQDEAKSQNALRELFRQPGNVDPATGMLKPEATAKLMAVSPAFGMDYNKAAAGLEEAKTRGEGAKADLAGKIRDMGLTMADETLGTYDAAVKSGMPPDQAQNVAQVDYTRHLDELRKTGLLAPEQLAVIPTNFDPLRVRNQLIDTKTRMAQDNKNRDEARADERLKFQEHSADVRAARSDAAAARASSGGTIFIDPATNRPMIINPKTARAEPVDMSAVTGPDGKVPTLAKVGATEKAVFTPKMGDLQAELALKGVSLPAGLRSREQQASLLNGLINKYPDKTTEEIADMVKTGKVELAAQMKEINTAAGIAGTVDVGLNELNKFIPKALAASDKVPRGNWVPMSSLLQAADSSISDPDLKELKLRTNAVMNAYDVVSARGGTDVEKRKLNRSLVLDADGPDAYKRGMAVLLDETKDAKSAALEATTVPERKSKDAGTASPSALPQAALAQLEKGHVTTFTNGQKWTLGDDGQPKQVQ